MSQHILHLANDFSGSQVYNQLARAIDKRGVRQSVFTTVRHKGQLGKNTLDFTVEGSTIYYSDNWSPWHRAFFRLKTKSNYAHLLGAIDPQIITHTHAHTLFSDGVLALKLKQDFGIPYNVTIRNTDINTFMKFMVHIWDTGRRVLNNAESVVCISPAHIQRVLKWKNCPPSFATKVINIPNGIDSYWLDNLSCAIESHRQDDAWHLLYVGNFSPNKNVPRLMSAIHDLNGQGYNLKLHIVGGGGEDTRRIESIASKSPETFHLYGVINDKEKIRALMQQCHIFTMPSLTETFGLVYVEALSQGLPILYTEGEGVDGFFTASYGESCNPHSVYDIASKIERMIVNYNEYAIEESYIRDHFDWEKVADRYLSLFHL